MCKLPLLLLLLPLTLAECPVAAILSNSDSSKVEDSLGNLRDALVVVPSPLWTSMEGAHWVWSDLNESLGTQKFVATFTLDEWKRDHLTSLKLYIATDDSNTVVFNGKTLNTDWFGGFGEYYAFDLKDTYLGSTPEATVENRLEISVLNVVGPGGLLYKVEATYN